ncbi:hypothetical protein BS47DRAFT_1487793 [Hydnum rufescens UP504]|uniref:START domain-containing protein n=1 Tax=Hydnum rufescens UP504 TaxID=1448309 RepID=A0A9P6APT1_9AGAM|nr:hypothetical protein BS47DRAFT_1487793 [Hydnum rufescens UP504]
MDRMEIPTDPAPNGYFSNPYEDLRDKTLAKLKEFCGDQDGWTIMSSTKADIITSKKQIPGDPSSIPLVKGQGALKGITPYQFYSVVALPGARQLWDDGFQQGTTVRRYSRRTFKFYSIQKGAFLVQPRDFVGFQEAIIEDDGTIYFFQASVPEDENTGPVKGRTRATLTISGWCIKPVHDGIDVTYVVKVNPNGSLPTALVKIVVTELPDVVRTAFAWCKGAGLMCHIKEIAIQSVVRDEIYDHTQRELYRLMLIGKAGDEFDIAVDDKVRYKKGYTLTIKGEAQGDIEATESRDNVHIKIGVAADGKKFELVIQTV